MTRPEPPTICFGTLKVKTLVFIFATVFSTMVFGQVPDGDSDPYKRDRYTIGYLPPIDRVYKREGPENPEIALRHKDFFYEWLHTVGSFGTILYSESEDYLFFFRKLSPEHHILVTIENHLYRFNWSEREIVLGEFIGTNAMNYLTVRRIVPGSYESLCSSGSGHRNFITDLKSTESDTLTLDEPAIELAYGEQWISIIHWEEGEFRTFCRYQL